MGTVEMFDSQLSRWNTCVRLDRNLVWHHGTKGARSNPNVLSKLRDDAAGFKVRWRTLCQLDHFHRQEIVNRIANILAIDQPTSQCR
jgi:hypothetical protein